MIAVIAPRGLESVVREELASSIQQQWDRIFLANSPAHTWFAQNIWFEPQEFKFSSVSQAAAHLRGIQRNWWLHSTHHHRRARLIVDKLPPFKPKRMKWDAPLPSSPLGSWTLLDQNTMLFSAKCSSPFADGEIEFEEDKVGPPSRAYLKLWEFFLLEQVRPSSQSQVLDLGSSPGGWTWALDQLGCKVISVDKAPLDSEIKFSDKVSFLSKNAFALDPAEVSGTEWLFSDIISYPSRLLELVLKWKDHVPNLVCTIKFQGPTDFAIVEEFLKIPGSKVRHLYNNKHELTWYRLKV